MGLIVSSQQPFDPTPRPALRKASDSTVHPATINAPIDAPKSLGAGHHELGTTSNTSDSVRTDKKEKLIAVTVTMPKSLRKKLKKEAKKRGQSFDEVVSERLQD